MLSHRVNVRTSKFWWKSKLSEIFSKIYQGHIRIWFRSTKNSKISHACVPLSEYERRTLAPINLIVVKYKTIAQCTIPYVNAGYERYSTTKVCFKIACCKQVYNVPHDILYIKIMQNLKVTSHIKGTQDWEFFWLRFWILCYFIVSYAQILRFCKKFLIRPLLGEIQLFR